MLKSFTPVVTLLLMVLLGRTRPSLKAVLSLLGISLGTCFAIYGEMHLHVYGLCVMLLSVFGESMRVVLAEVLLRDYKFSVMDGRRLFFTIVIIIFILKKEEGKGKKVAGRGCGCGC